VGGCMHKTAKNFLVFLSLAIILVAGAVLSAGCGSGSSGVQAAATTDSAYTDKPLADLIDLTNSRLSKAIEYTRLLKQALRVTGTVEAITAGAEPSSWQVSIVVPGNQDAGSVTLELTDPAFATLVDAGNSDGIKVGSSVTAEGEFTGVNKEQLPTIIVHNIIFDGTTYSRAQ
jgi:hypothetical protein